jgi:hypothetical protein
VTSLLGDRVLGGVGSGVGRILDGRTGILDRIAGAVERVAGGIEAALVSSSASLTVFAVLVSTSLAAGVLCWQAARPSAERRRVRERSSSRRVPSNSCEEYKSFFAAAPKRPLGPSPARREAAFVWEARA